MKWVKCPCRMYKDYAQGVGFVKTGDWYTDTSRINFVPLQIFFWIGTRFTRKVPLLSLNPLVPDVH